MVQLSANTDKSLKWDSLYCLMLLSLLSFGTTVLLKLFLSSISFPHLPYPNSILLTMHYFILFPQFYSPRHALFHTIPDYTNLKIFGCQCFPHLRPFNKHKFQFRSSPCVYLGMSPQHKGHKCLDASGRVYISKDVVFNESVFPYASMFPHSSSPISTTSQYYPATICVR